MFKKALAHQSNATPLRSSARRQLVTAILAQHPSILTGVQDDDAINGKEVGKLIVPEGVRSGAFETSGGVEGTLYSSPDGDPLWMTLGRNSKEYIPTLNLLSIDLPNPPLPILQLHHPLPPPILTGAPLFVPALRNLSRPHLLPDVPKGGLVAFVTSEDNGLDVSYVGVGRVVAEGGTRGAVERRIQKLRADADTDEGKFCEVLCILDDHLWDLGSKPTLPVFSLPQPLRPLAPPPQTEAGPSRPRTPVTQATDSLEQLSVNPNETKPSATLTASDISTLLSLALLQVLSAETSPLPNFPIPSSQLYSAHVLPSRPAYIPKDKREDVVIGKSEWKKLAKWMKEAGKDGLLKIKESKGEVTVQGFDAKHPSLQSFASFATIAQDEAKAAKRAAREAASVEGTVAPGKGKSKELDIEELWRPSGGTVSFWEAAGVEKSSLNPTSSLKSTFDAYLVKHSLVDSKNHRMVNLDEELGKAVGIKRLEMGHQMPRDELFNKLRANVAWLVSVGGVVKKGALQPITMSVKTRQGRKTVTTIAGLETFGVDIDEFAEELRKKCAGSASVQPLSGASPKLNLQEIMVQGSQVKLATEALMERGVPKRWIKEADGGKKR